MDFTLVLVSIVVFLGIILLLVTMLLGVKAKLLPSGPVALKINGQDDLKVSSGATLLILLEIIKYFYHRLVEEVELAFSVDAKLYLVEVRFYQRRNHIFREEKLLTVGD